MRLGTLLDLRFALGTKPDGTPAVCESFACALKKAAGITARKFDIHQAVKWLRENPHFKMSDVYKRKPKSESPCSSERRSVSVVGTSRE